VKSISRFLWKMAAKKWRVCLFLANFRLFLNSEMTYQMCKTWTNQIPGSRNHQWEDYGALHCASDWGSVKFIAACTQNQQGINATKLATCALPIIPERRGSIMQMQLPIMKITKRSMLKTEFTSKSHFWVPT
jgi:hypothetical protein